MTLHYLLMANHLRVQKALLAQVRRMGLTPGQPKVLDDLLDCDGAVQREIARRCHIEPATLTSVLLGMEENGLIERRQLNGNRRSLYVFLTQRGRQLAEQVRRCFEEIEGRALFGLDKEQQQQLITILTKISKNLGENGEEEEDESDAC